MPEQGAKAYMTELIAKVIMDMGWGVFEELGHGYSILLCFGDDDYLELEILEPRGHAKVRATVHKSHGVPPFEVLPIGALGRRQPELARARHVASRFVFDLIIHTFFEFREDQNEVMVGGSTLIDLRELDMDHVRILLHSIDHGFIHHPFSQFLDPAPFIIPSALLPTSLATSSSLGSLAPSLSGSLAPSSSVSRSTFRTPSKSGKSFSWKTDHFTGSGSKVKVKNGIIQTELQNTASSSLVYPKNPLVYPKNPLVYPKNPLVYPHTTVHNKNNPEVRKNTGRDASRLVAPLSSFQALGGKQRNPFTRRPMGHQNLRKISPEEIQAAVAHEINKRIARKKEDAKRKHEEEEELKKAKKARANHAS